MHWLVSVPSRGTSEGIRCRPGSARLTKAAKSDGRWPADSGGGAATSKIGNILTAAISALTSP